MPEADCHPESGKQFVHSSRQSLRASRYWCPRYTHRMEDLLADMDTGVCGSLVNVHD